MRAPQTCVYSRVPSRRPPPPPPLVQMANSLRRIMIEEAPTIAIENVFIVNNTGVMSDEALAHRLGLIPLKIDPSLFEYRVSRARGWRRLLSKGGGGPCRGRVMHGPREGGQVSGHCTREGGQVSG